MGGEVGIHDGAKKKIDIDLELLKHSRFWFSIHHFCRFLKNILLSHGLFVVIFTALIAFICSNAQSVKGNVDITPPSATKNDYGYYHESNFPVGCIVNHIENSNYQEDKEKVLKNEQNTIKRKRSEYKTQRNECPIGK